MAKKKRKKSSSKKTNTKKTGSTQKKVTSSKKESIKKKSPAKKTQPKPPVPEGIDVFDKLLGENTRWVAVGLLALLCFVIFGSYLFGGQLFLFKDIGSDTINFYFPRLVHTAEHLNEEGMLGWSFQQGLGMNALPYSLGDPFNWILYAMGPDNLAYGIAWIECLKIFTAGVFFYAYLRELKLNYQVALIGALFYAFSGFMMVGAGWYIFTTQGAFVAMLLLGFERLFREKNSSWWLFTLAVFLLAVSIPFDLYMAAVLLFFYSTLRIFDRYGLQPKRFFQTYLSMVIWGALGVVMSSILMIAAVDQMLHSPRVAGGSAMFEKMMNKSFIADEAQFQTIFGRLFSSDFLGTAAGSNEIINGQRSMQLNYTGWQKNYLESPAIYAGLATLLLIPQTFALLPNNKKRILYAVGLGLILIPLFFPFFRVTIWLYSGDYYRAFSLFVIFALLFVALQGLHLIHKHKKVNLFILVGSLIFWLAMLFLPFMNSEVVKVDGALRNYIFIFLLMEAGAIWAMNLPKHRATARIALVALVALECIMMGLYSYGNIGDEDKRRSVITKEEYQQKVGFNDYTKDAVAKLEQQDKGFFRIEKYGYSSGPAMHGSQNDAMIQGYNGSQSYHSFNNLNYIRFLDGVNIIADSIENQTRWAPGVMPRPLLQTITSHKYLLSRQPVPQTWYKMIDSVQDVKIYQNPYFVPFGFTYDKIWTEEQLQQLPAENGAIAKQVGLLKAMTIAQEDMAAFGAMPQFDPATINTNYQITELQQDAAALADRHLNIEKFSSNHIVGSIEVDKPQALFISTPIDPGWTAQVDGQPAKLYRANLGFMALPLAAGNHQIELSFTPPYWTMSWLLSLIGWLAFAGLLFWSWKRKTRAETHDAGSEAQGEFEDEEI